MADPIAKAQFLTRLRDSREAWDAAIRQLRPSDFDTPGFCGDWTAKEVVGHLAWYEGEMINILERRQFISSELWDLSLDSRNAEIRARLRHLPGEEALQEEASTYVRLSALLEELDQRFFNDPSAFPPMPDDWRPWQVFASNTYEHYDDHLVPAKEFLRTRLTTR